MRKKVSKVRERGYISKGQVSSLMNMFDVPKGSDDIRMVYDGTKSGLNACLWVLWFPLPTVDGLLRSVCASTWLGDNDMGEQFHNFSLHLTLQVFCGVDLTRLFPTNDATAANTQWERWTRAPMGIMQSPHQAAQGMIWWEEMVRGDRSDPSNVFWWERVILNLPGIPAYRPLSLGSIRRARMEQLRRIFGLTLTISAQRVPVRRIVGRQRVESGPCSPMQASKMRVGNVEQ